MLVRTVAERRGSRRVDGHRRVPSGVDGALAGTWAVPAAPQRRVDAEGMPCLGVRGDPPVDLPVAGRGVHQPGTGEVVRAGVGPAQPADGAPGGELDSSSTNSGAPP